MSSLLSGPDPRDGMETWESHSTRLDPRPRGGVDLIDTLARSDLRGRGGAGFPAATKWRSVAAAGGGPPVVLVNGAEGEPLSSKDRVLMETRPHLVLDGAALAAETLGARRVVLYVGEQHAHAASALGGALQERPADEQRRTTMVSSPQRYVAGEETAAVHLVNDGVALPTSTPPRPFEAGVDGRPTLVQNVETLAHAAMIARFGDGWFRSLGATSSGTVLLTVSGSVAAPGVIEVAHGTTVAGAVAAAGGLVATPRAVLLGGYFGGWVDARAAWHSALDGVALRERGMTLGCGVLAVLPESRCGVVETSRMLSWLADESARQCGPCVFGLRAIAQAVARLASGAAQAGELARARRWAGQVRGRGACHHPDGAAALLQSALTVFAEDFDDHQAGGRCSRCRQVGRAA